jgi:hypothetical protein
MWTLCQRGQTMANSDKNSYLGRRPLKDEWAREQCLSFVQFSSDARPVNATVVLIGRWTLKRWPKTCLLLLLDRLCAAAQAQLLSLQDHRGHRGPYFSGMGGMGCCRSFMRWCLPVTSSTACCIWACDADVTATTCGGKKGGRNG